MKNRRVVNELSDLELAVPGFSLLQHDPVLGPRDPDPANTFSTSSDDLRLFLQGRDLVAFLARSGFELLLAMSEGMAGKEPPIEQFEVELLQSFALGMKPGSQVPTSPRNMARGWTIARTNIKVYPAAKFPSVSDEPLELLSRQARVQTLYYRNIFNSRDARIIVPSLLAHMDRTSDEVLGYRLSDLSRALFQLLEILPRRIDAQANRVRPMVEGRFDETVLANFLETGAPARRAWRFAEKKFSSPADLALAAFQLSEMCWAPVFTFSRSQLEELFGKAIATAMFDLSIGFGDLADVEPSRLYLESPIRQRPFIRLSEDELFLPIPGLIISFPFAMVEALIENRPALLTAYASARTQYLEESTADIIRTALPSASVYSSVHWDDPETGKHYENDVVAVLGNHIFLFEAKSGKLKPASRRGGASSLRKNLKELYIEPGLQASRLQAFLSRDLGGQKLLKDRRGRLLDIDLTRPAVITSFGVCIESLGYITSNRRQLEEIGLLGASDPWSPIFSIGDMRMLDAHLDTEVAFFHYLTRRATIEQVLDFHGDEQDLLSVYLTNSFHLDREAIEGVRIVFNQADQPVRQIKEPRSDRRQFDMPGIQLPASWKRLGADLYTSDSRHRFDMLETILNLHPMALLGLEKCVRRWKAGGGGGGKGVQFVRTDIGERTFALGLLLERDQYWSAEEWHSHARSTAQEIYSMVKPTDCVILLKLRRSKASYDAISFFRMNKMSDGELAIRSALAGGW